MAAMVPTQDAWIRAIAVSRTSWAPYASSHSSGSDPVAHMMQLHT